MKKYFIAPQRGGRFVGSQYDLNGHYGIFERTSDGDRLRILRDTKAEAERELDRLLRARNSRAG